MTGDCAALLQEIKGFHWMMACGNFLRESYYALKTLGVDFHDVSAAKAAWTGRSSWRRLAICSAADWQSAGVV